MNTSFIAADILRPAVGVFLLLVAVPVLPISIYMLRKPRNRFAVSNVLAGIMMLLAGISYLAYWRWQNDTVDTLLNVVFVALAIAIIAVVISTHRKGKPHAEAGPTGETDDERHS